MIRRYQRVQAIFKVVERCNLACSYCYYFNLGDRSYEQRPAVVAPETAEATVDYLCKSAVDLGLRQLWVCFHGGEPTLLKPRVFDAICERFKSRVPEGCQLSLSIQTNGLHINEEWLSLFRKHSIEIGVSIDGDKKAHDRFRLDHFGKGSFDRIAANFRRVKAFCAENQMKEPEIIAVLDAGNQYRDIIPRLANELGVRGFNFLLPDCNHDDGIPGGYSARDYGKVLCDIFDAWVDLEATIAVREIAKMLPRFQLAVLDESKAPAGTGYTEIRNQIVVIRSDGDVQVDDTYIPAGDWRNTLPVANVQTGTLQQYLEEPVFNEIDEIYSSPPGGCAGCTWVNVCNGGDIENRYSKANGFNNPSVYCEGLRMFYRRIAGFLRRNGYPREVLRDRLLPSEGLHQYRYER